MSILLNEVMDMSFKITWKTHVICTIIAFVIAKVMGSTATNIVENFISKTFYLLPNKKFNRQFLHICVTTYDSNINCS